jgi:hypothetical protein
MNAPSPEVRPRTSPPVDRAITWDKMKEAQACLTTLTDSVARIRRDLESSTSVTKRLHDKVNVARAKTVEIGLVRFYLERMYASRMKVEERLWDGTADTERKEKKRRVRHPKKNRDIPDGDAVGERGGQETHVKAPVELDLDAGTGAVNDDVK